MRGKLIVAAIVSLLSNNLVVRANAEGQSAEDLLPRQDFNDTGPSKAIPFVPKLPTNTIRHSIDGFGTTKEVRRESIRRNNYLPNQWKEYRNSPQRDLKFRERWQLTLDPPIRVSQGLGADGPVIGPPFFSCSLIKVGNRIWGTGGYSYSCGSSAGGTIDGTINDGIMKLILTGSPNIEFVSSSITNERITGTAIVTGTVKGGSHSGGTCRFVLTAMEDRKPRGKLFPGKGALQ